MEGSLSEALQLQQQSLPGFTSQPPSASCSKNSAPLLRGGVGTPAPHHPTYRNPRSGLSAWLHFWVRQSLFSPFNTGQQREASQVPAIQFHPIQSTKPSGSSLISCPAFSWILPVCFIHPTPWLHDKEHNVRITHLKTQGAEVGEDGSTERAWAQLLPHTHQFYTCTQSSSSQGRMEALMNNFCTIKDKKIT